MVENARLSTMNTDKMYTLEAPARLQASNGLHLLTTNTPNGQAVQIMLEELAELYNTTWTTTLIDLKINEQKSDWFLQLNPNGRIPVLVDHGPDRPFAIHESSAELLYLLHAEDKDDVLGFKDPTEQSEALQWVFFCHGSVTPHLGQIIHFTKYAPEKIPYAIDRFRNEALRVFGVLEVHLSGQYEGEARDYLAGRGKGRYSVADIKTWSWLKAWERIGFTPEEMNSFPSILRWIDRIASRPAVKRGIGEKYNRED